MKRILRRQQDTLGGSLSSLWHFALASIESSSSIIRMKLAAWLAQLSTISCDLNTRGQVFPYTLDNC